MTEAQRREAMIAGFNLAIGFLAGYFSSYPIGDRQHLIDNVEAVKGILRDDLEPDHPESGALTEAFLIGLGDIARTVAERHAGSVAEDEYAQLVGAIAVFGNRVSSSSAQHPPVPIPGWSNAQCPGCGQPVYEADPHRIAIRNLDGQLIAEAFHPGCT